MAQTPTADTMSLAKIETPLPAGFHEAMIALVERRNKERRPGQRKLHLRDIQGEAIMALGRQEARGRRVTYIAVPTSQPRKPIWMEPPVREELERLATTAGITRASVIVTAFSLYLSRKGLGGRRVAPAERHTAA